MQVRTAYTAPNDWSDNSVNVQASRGSGELLDYDWNLLHKDEQLYLQYGLQEAILMKQKSLRYLRLPNKRPTHQISSVIPGAQPIPPGFPSEDVGPRRSTDNEINVAT